MWLTLTITIVLSCQNIRVFLQYGIKIRTSTYLFFLWFLIHLILYGITRKQELLENSIKGDLLLKADANYYLDRYISSGTLFLTAEQLIYISEMKRAPLRLELPLENITHIEREIVYANLSGLRVGMSDDLVHGFVQDKTGDFLDKINGITDLQAKIYKDL